MTRTSNIRFMGRCYDGKVSRWREGVTETSGYRYFGVSVSDCQACGGKGCSKSGDAALAAATDGLTDTQKREIAEAVERIMGSGA